MERDPQTTPQAQRTEVDVTAEAPDYQPPTLDVLGTVDELTQFTPGAGHDGEGSS